MFNVKVFKVSNFKKYVIKIIIIGVVIFGIIKISEVIKNIGNSVLSQKIELFNYDLIECIDNTSTIIKDTNKSSDIEIKAYKNDLFEDILKSQIGSIEDFTEETFNENINNIVNGEKSNNSNQNDDNISNNKENDENKDSGAEKSNEKGKQKNSNAEGKNKSTDHSKEVNNEEDTNKKGNNAENNISLAKTGLTTEIITQNPITLNYNVEYQKVKIKNETSHELTQDMLTPNIKIDNKKILLFHTHTCESYTSSEKFKYTPTGNYRTTNLNYSVVRVADEYEAHLKKYGYNVIHDRSYHDYPSYNGSYAHSLETVKSILKENPTDIIFDVHRDAIGSRSDYAPTVKIGEDETAQIMFVIGSDEGGLWHPNWNQNLKFAVKVQEKAEELYPGLFKPITLTKYRYNQHSGKYANIIEVGATGNTMEQCLNSMKYLSKVMDEVLKEK